MRRTYLRSRSIAAAVLCSALVAAGAARARLAVQWLGRADGLPNSQVHDLAQDRDSRLWLAGPSGLVRYDGQRFDVFLRADGLSANGLRSLAKAPDGRLWIGTDKGVDMHDRDGLFSPLVPPETWRYGVVEAMVIEPSGGAWIATPAGLLRWTPARGLEAVADPRLYGVPVTALARGDDGTVWASAAGLLSYDGAAWKECAAAALAVGDVEAIAPVAGGALIGGERGLVEVDAGGRLVHRLIDQGPVTAVLVAGDELWLGMGGELRLYRRRGDGWELAEAVARARINRLLADVEGNVWAATDDAGVAKVSVLRHAIQQADQPCPTQVYSFAATAAGELLVGGDQCSFRLRPADLSLAESYPALDGVKVWDLQEDRAGTLWAASEGGLWRRPPGGELRPLRLASPILAAPARVLLERPDGMLVGTVAGLVEVRGTEATPLTGAAGESPGYVYTLVEDGAGTVWAGTLGNGLWRLTTGGVLERVALPGLDKRGSVYSIAFGPGDMLAVSQDEHLLIWRDGELERLKPGDAVPGWSIRFDAAGNLWAGGDNGLRRFDLHGERPPLHLTASMGLAGNELTTSRSLWLDPRGRVWAGTTGGLTVVDPASLALLRPLPPVRASSIEWSQVEVRRKDGATIVPAGAWGLEVQVYVPWFADERSIVFRHRLAGFDRRWSPYGDRGEHRIQYTALPAGDFELEVQAYSPVVGESPKTNLLRFRVLPPWWLRRWAIALWALSLLGLGYAAWRHRSRVLIAHAEELARTVELKTTELRQAIADLDRLAHRDALTGLPNQRRFWEQGRRFEARARRSGVRFAMVVLDLDNFKAINDHWGHQVGDRVLKAVGKRLQQMMRLEDFVARYGGEEFVALLSAADETAVTQAAERLRRALAATPVVTREGRTIDVTASFGAALWQGPGDDLESMFKRADAALYAAKRTKNRVVIWDPSLIPSHQPPPAPGPDGDAHA